MIKEREALKLALEALVAAEAGLADIGDADREPTDDLAWCEERAAQALAKPRQAITAIKEALAQPEHSATYQKINLSLLKHSDNCRFWDEGDLCTCGASEFHELQFWKNKALAQPEMRPDEISTDELIYMNGLHDGMKQERALWELSRLGQEIEAQPEQEPAAFPNRRAVEREIERIQNPKGMHLNDGKERVILPGGTLRSLLALADRSTSPQRQWVGLTDEEIAQGCKESWVTEQAWQSAVWWAEAKLKEKNFD